MPLLMNFIHKKVDKHLSKKNARKNQEHQDRITGAGNTLEQKLAAGESFGTAFLKDSIAKGREFEAFGEKLRGRHTANVNNTDQERRRLEAGAGSSVQQKFQSTGGGPRGFANNLEQTVRRGKARQGIVNRGEKAINNQQLKDRLTASKDSIKRRGQIQQTSANAALLRSSADAASVAASSQISASNNGAFGAIAGGAVRGFGGKFFDDTGGIDSVAESVDEGTAGADFFNDQNRQGSKGFGLQDDFFSNTPQLGSA